MEEWPDTSNPSVPYWPAWLTEDEYMNNIYGEYNPRLQGYMDRLNPGFLKKYDEEREKKLKEKQIKWKEEYEKSLSAQREEGK